MFRYYLGVAIFCLVFAVFSIFIAANAAALIAIFLGLAGVFLTIAFITSGPESRW